MSNQIHYLTDRFNKFIENLNDEKLDQLKKNYEDVYQYALTDPDIERRRGTLEIMKYKYEDVLERIKKTQQSR